LAISSQLAVGVARLEPRQPHGVEHAADPEGHGGALDGVGKRRLRVVALPYILASDAVEGQLAADVQRRRLAVASRSAWGERSRKGREARPPALAADVVEPVVDEPGVDIGGDLSGVIRGALDLEANGGRARRPPQVRQRLGQ
jgi:hypothetical protein